MSVRSRCLIPWEAGTRALARSPAGLKVDKARGKVGFLTHIGPHGRGQPLWLDLELAVRHYEQRHRPQIVARLLDAARSHGVDSQDATATEEKPSR